MLLYIHIPFCDSKCNYCSFNSYVDKFDLVSQYFDALLVQLEKELRSLSCEIQTVFIGGGTPSAVDAKYYKKIFDLLGANIKEITVEANPNSASSKWQEQMARYGVNRISFGVQSFDAKKLHHLNRSHSPQGAFEAINIAKQNFCDISIDLLYNCAVDSHELLRKDLEQFFALDIGHLSAYELTPQKGTKFENLQLEQDRYGEYIFDLMASSGFKQYEVANYGKPSLHNLGYWEYKEYIGIGAGAVGMVGSSRYKPYEDIGAYIQDPTYKEFEHLLQEDIEMEKIFLGLRSQVGFVPANIEVEKRAKELEDRGKLIKIKNRYYNKDFFLADELALYLLK